MTRWNVTVRERRKLQRYLVGVRGTPQIDADFAELLGLLVGDWSFDRPLPPDAATPRSLPAGDCAVLREAVQAELPELQRAVHPAPGWRRR